MEIGTDGKAIRAALLADQYPDDDLFELLDRGFAWYNDDADKLVADVDYFFRQSMDSSVRTTRPDEPPLTNPARATVIAAVTACAIRMHPKVENAPPEKIQLIQYVRQYHTEMILAILVEEIDGQPRSEVYDKLYEAEVDPDRPRQATGATAVVERPDEHPDFDWFTEIPLVAASEICRARFHDGSWGGDYNPETDEVLGDPNSHIDNNCIYVPVQHGMGLLAERQKEVFERLVNVTWNSVPEKQFQYVYNGAEVIKETIEDLIRHGEQEDLWTDWDPQQNLLRLVRNAAKAADDLDATEFNQAEDYYEAIRDYDASGFGESQAERNIKSVMSLAKKLGKIADSSDYPAVQIQRYDRGTADYSVGRGSGNYKQITVDDLDDIFELPCFQNMIDALKLDNGGPVRKDLFNFVRMVYWLEGYHDLPEAQREDAVVEDIHELFEDKWEWYDEDTTDYQARYELRNGNIHGDPALPMHCDNHDMQRHCIGKSFCPYDIYQSLPFPEAMFEQLEDNDDPNKSQA